MAVRRQMVNESAMRGTTCVRNVSVSCNMLICIPAISQGFPDPTYPISGSIPDGVTGIFH